jgi:hypothetical protein
VLGFFLGVSYSFCGLLRLLTIPFSFSSSFNMSNPSAATTSLAGPSTTVDTPVLAPTAQVGDDISTLCADETLSLESRQALWRSKFKRYATNPDPHYWDDRGRLHAIVFPPAPSSSDQDLSDDSMGDEEESSMPLAENDGPTLPDEDMIRLTDLWSRQRESLKKFEKIWKDFEDIHGWTDRGRAAWRKARQGQLGRQIPPWEVYTKVSRDHYGIHIYPWV